MKILQVCPLWFPIAQDSPGGIETFLHQLIAPLEKLGCHITLIASGDSSFESGSDADLLSVTPTSLCEQMTANTAAEYTYYEQHQLRMVLEVASAFDVVHCHIGAAAYLLSGLPSLQSRVLHTIHTPVYKDLQWFVRQHPDMWLSTVSEYQAERLRAQGATRSQAIPNGIDVSRFTFHERGGDDLVFVGRIERVKGPDLAVQAARTLCRPLILAGPILEQEFFDRTIKPYLNDQIRYVGVVDHQQKNRLFGEASCAILPFRRAEPFGLVSIEAMACGTPVVSLANGALPEIVDAGLTGYLADTEQTLPAMVGEAVKLDRAAIRARVTTRFDITAIAQQYYALYEKICSDSKSGSRKTA
jgi:glycosyltransferase involved in cell wall biosynthesis